MLIPEIWHHLSDGRAENPSRAGTTPNFSQGFRLE
jgi:hypothetical protein